MTISQCQRATVFVFLLLLAFVGSCLGKSASDIESRLTAIGSDTAGAVLPITLWRHDPIMAADVVGTAFLVTGDGYFVTAAHVLGVEILKMGRLSVILKQRDGSGSGLSFDVIEKDESHDLALCKIENFVPMKSGRAPLDTDVPVATLDISAETLQQGQFVAIVGFPLGSWNPALQFGNVAATEIVNSAPSMRVPAGQRDLLQINVSGNKGDSGGPVISLRTGKVVGVIIQLVPAPVLSAIPVPEMQNSGMMVALPAKWVRDLLTRNHVVSSEHKPREKLILKTAGN